ncbi:MAG: Yip1 family protein [Deltaproteobacteria bacterium]|nr:Yip1 family protein [Deltaproteobacteria bacterium]
MKAQCSTCQQTFDTESFGPQDCPHCGMRVHLVDPRAQPREEPAAAAPEPPAAEARTPWEEREKRGFFAGFLETTKQALFHPRELFEPMTVSDTRGAFSYAWIATTVGGVFALLWGWIQWKTQAAQMANMTGGDPQVAELIGQMVPLMDLLYGGLGFVLLPISSVISIFLGAGLLHLMVMMVGANNRGFNATFRAYCFGQAPQLFAALPACGGMVALVWSLALSGYALIHLQRTTGGKATAAVLLVVALGCLCCCLLYGIVAASVVAAMGGGGLG